MSVTIFSISITVFVICANRSLTRFQYRRRMQFSNSPNCHSERQARCDEKYVDCSCASNSNGGRKSEKKIRSRLRTSRTLTTDTLVQPLLYTHIIFRVIRTATEQQTVSGDDYLFFLSSSYALALDNLILVMRPCSNLICVSFYFFSVHFCYFHASASVVAIYLFIYFIQIHSHAIQIFFSNF